MVRALEGGGSRGVAEDNGGVAAALNGGGAGEVVQVDDVRHALASREAGQRGPLLPKVVPEGGPEVVLVHECVAGEWASIKWVWVRLYHFFL